MRDTDRLLCSGAPHGSAQLQWQQTLVGDVDGAGCVWAGAGWGEEHRVGGTSVLWEKVCTFY